MDTLYRTLCGKKPDYTGSKGASAEIFVPYGPSHGDILWNKGKVFAKKEKKNTGFLNFAETLDLENDLRYSSRREAIICVGIGV